MGYKDITLELDSELRAKAKLLEKSKRYYEDEMERIDARLSGDSNPTIDPQPKAKYRTDHDSKIIELIHQKYYKLDGNNKSLMDNYNEVCWELSRINIVLNEREKLLKTLKGREYRLYTLIVIDGYRPTKAVEQLAKEENIESSNIWNREYKEIKKYLDLIVK